MGKVKKQRKRLHEQIADEHIAQPSSRFGKGQNEVEETQEAMFVDEKLSKKILAQAKKQGEELFNDDEFPALGAPKVRKGKKGEKSSKQVHLGGASGGKDSDDDDEEEDNRHLFDTFSSLDKTVMAITEDEEADLRQFMNPNPKERRTLADIINEKLAEKKTSMTEAQSEAPYQEELDDTIRQHFIAVGEVMARYRSGKVPKGFKAIPSFSNWQQFLELTRPEKWTAASIYAGTRLFVSNLPKYNFKDFCALVLLPRIRDDIAEYKRLNFHLFQALHKSMYKPGDFFEGIVLPLCESGDCTLREATIVAGVVAQSSIPVGYSAAALILISKMEYNGANSIFMRTILNKKYSLPLSAIDALVEHFMGFMEFEGDLPVLWHQCLLTLVQRYKEDLKREQKSMILKLLHTHEHHEISPEIRREITHSKRSRGDPQDMDI